MSDAVRFAVNVEAAVHREGEYLLAERAATEDHAAGARSLVGGTVEREEDGEDVLAATVRREVREEVGVRIGETAYVTSAQFVDDGGTPCVNVVLLARHEAGEGEVREPEEVARVGWFTPEAVRAHEDVPAFTREYVAAAEERRRELGW